MLLGTTSSDVTFNNVTNTITSTIVIMTSTEPTISCISNCKLKHKRQIVLIVCI